MHRERTQQNIYTACEKEGTFIPLAKIDVEQIRSIVKVALIDLTAANEWAKKANKESGQWNAIYKLYYDVLHGLCEAFIHFDKIKVKTHECLFAYLCEKHSELELDWNFLEKVRTKRNGIQYYGNPANYGDWKEIEVQINLCINTIKKALEKKLEK